MRISLLAAGSVLAFGLASLGASAQDLPAYPGAKSHAIHGSKAVAMCGHQVTVVADYKAKDSPEKLAAWYESRIPGALTVRDSGDPNQTKVEVYDADGARAAIISLMHFSSALASSAATLGLDQTDIGIERFDPPLGHALLDLMKQSKSGSAQAKAASAKIAGMCPSN